jgi:hypothetical protein
MSHTNVQRKERTFSSSRPPVNWTPCEEGVKRVLFATPFISGSLDVCTMAGICVVSYHWNTDRKWHPFHILGSYLLLPPLDILNNGNCPRAHTSAFVLSQPKLITHAHTFWQFTSEITVLSCLYWILSDGLTLKWIITIALKLVCLLRHHNTNIVIKWSTSSCDEVI